MSRREGERIVLTLPDGRLVTLHVATFRNRGKDAAVRLGIDCDRSIPIRREGGPTDGPPERENGGEP